MIWLLTWTVFNINGSYSDSVYQVDTLQECVERGEALTASADPRLPAIYRCEPYSLHVSDG